jgi:hypothetical protein
MENDFTVRLEQVYRSVTGEESSRGAKAWFARLNGVQAYTVTRWCSGMAPSYVRAHLATLEQVGTMQSEMTTVKETNTFLLGELKKAKKRKKRGKVVKANA